jgi:hypothetical protein
MGDPLIQLLLWIVPPVLVVGAWAIARLVARRKLRHALTTPRPWQLPTVQSWVQLGWIEPELVEALPPQLSPAQVFYEWAWADPESAAAWRFREPVLPTTPVEALVRDAWAQLPADQRAPRREALAAAVQRAGTWWGGAEQGWNRRPLAVLEAAVSKKQSGLPLIPLEDLTAAPLPGPLRAETVAAEAEGPDLVLALFALRRATPRFVHPLAPRTGSGHSLITGLSTRVAVDVGRRVGAGLGAALGPIGSMVGQYLGELAGNLGGKMIAEQALPQMISGALREAETTLSGLGKLSATDDFARAAALPAQAILETGQRLELVRMRRAFDLREWVWPRPGLVLVEAVMRTALAEMTGYRAAADHFVATARKAPEAVAGGMLLQNPWLVRSIPGAVERLNAVRAALNRAALALHREA